MNFRSDKVKILKALRAGMVLHEDRSDQELKNLVDSGEVSLEIAYRIIESTRGTQAESSPHHFSKDVTVWIFKPKFNGTEWYVKCYLVDEDLWILSFHD